MAKYRSGQVADTHEMEPAAMRDVYCGTLMEMACKDRRIAVLESDLATPVGVVPFAKAYPGNFFNCGIQEGNMVGIAAGLSAAGAIPFAHTFAAFASRRCLDQLFVSAAFAQLNVRLVGSDPGITALYNGGTHMGLEDMGVLMGIPNITLVEPADSAALADALRTAKDRYGITYIRMNRKSAVQIYRDGARFEPGKGVVVRDGDDVTIIASGIMVAESLKAAERLSRRGIEARVVDMFTWKPLDEELIVRCADETGAIVTAENNQLASGLGKSVGAVVACRRPVPVGCVGIDEAFGEVGDMAYLMQQFGLDAPSIEAKAIETLARKNDCAKFD